MFSSSPYLVFLFFYVYFAIQKLINLSLIAYFCYYFLERLTWETLGMIYVRGCFPLFCFRSFMGAMSYVPNICYLEFILEYGMRVLTLHLFTCGFPSIPTLLAEECLFSTVKTHIRTTAELMNTFNKVCAKQQINT